METANGKPRPHRKPYPPERARDAGADVAWSSFYAQRLTAITGVRTLV